MKNREYVLWLSILLTACYLLWRRREQPQPTPRAHNPFSDEAFTAPKRTSSVKRETAVPDPFIDQTIDQATQGRIEVIKEKPGQEYVDTRFAALKNDVRGMFDDIDARRQERLRLQADEFEAWQTEQRQISFRRYKQAGLYDDLTDTEIWALIDGDQNVRERVYGKLGRKIAGADNGRPHGESRRIADQSAG